MSAEHPDQHSPVDIHQHDEPSPAWLGRSAARSGILALVLCLAAFVVSSPLLLIPYIGFVPALLTAAGIAIAGTGLRRSDHGTRIAVTGLILSVVVFALLAGIATLWNLVVADPAVHDYDELHEVIDYIKTLVFGS